MLNPLLEPAEHTAEDAIIWAHLNWRGGPRGGSLRWTTSLMQDRRDAALMLRAQYQRQWLPATGGVPALLPWLRPVEWACGPVGGDIGGYT